MNHFMNDLIRFFTSDLNNLLETNSGRGMLGTMILFWVICGAIVAVFTRQLILSVFVNRMISYGEGIIIFLVTASAILVGVNFFYVNLTIAIVTLMLIVTYFSMQIIVRRRGEIALKEQIDLDIDRCRDQIAANPRNMAAHERLGDIYRSLKDFDKALHCYDNVRRLTPANIGETLINKKIKSTEKDKEFYSSNFSLKKKEKAEE